MGVVYFVVLVGALVFVHELGHFLFAKAFGVRVLKFSVGFGPAIAGFRAGETEYVLGIVPIGGYVRMWGELPSDEVREEDKARSFDGRPLWQRAAIVLAGPAMNLLFPLLLFFVVFLGDDRLTPPVIGTVFPGRPADGVLFTGDEVLSIDGEEVATFEDVRNKIRNRPGETLVIRLRRGETELEVALTPAETEHFLELERVETIGRVGIDPYRRSPVIGVIPGGAAHAAGLRSFDVVVAVQGTRVDDYEDLSLALADTPSLISITYLRPVRTRALGGLVELATFTPHVANVNPARTRAEGPLRIGIEPADLYVHRVELDSPEARLGLQPGDRIIALDGEPMRLWPSFVAGLRASPGQPHTLLWRRGQELHEGTLTLAQERGVTEHGQAYERTHLAMSGWMPLRVDDAVDNPSVFSHACRRAWEETSEMVSLTVTSVLRLFQGRVGVSTIGGPLMMFDAAGQAAEQGATNYLKLMAFISVNLGLLNLLPIPLLDGGQLMFLAVEASTRRRIGVRIRRIASIIGFFILLLLMGLAIKNDVDRLFPGDESANVR